MTPIKVLLLSLMVIEVQGIYQLNTHCPNKATLKAASGRSCSQNSDCSNGKWCCENKCGGKQCETVDADCR
ncbi:hypothetical protein ElyMa_002664300 [Elysia marginata]|uniref:WAP domain-containing protein n=1 Tax=Elysia marginata TaxID=1093978 RepID=A0AAV4H8J7_9GAST|nr:hypothetical protein ElyMa_002664300 [Elysia marginata]